MPGPSSIIRVRDYAPGDNSAGQGPAVAAAIADFLTGQMSHTGAVLDFGSGQYRIGTTPLVIGNTDGSPVTGKVVGDSPDACQLFADPGIGRAFTFNEYFHGTVEGFSLQGAGYGTWAAGTNTDYGLVFARTSQDLGSTGVIVNSIWLGGFAHGLNLGDDQPPYGAAAEFVLTALEFQYCQTAVAFAEFNSMDFVFNKPAMIHCGTGMQVTFQGTTQVLIRGGSATNNGCDFDFDGNSGTIVIDGFRSEQGPQNAGAPVKIGGGSGAHFEISNCLIGVGSDYRTTSVEVNNGQTSLFLSNNFLMGPVRNIQGQGTIISQLNAIWVEGGDRAFDSDPNTPIGEVFLQSTGDFLTSGRVGGWFGSALPMINPGVWLTGAQLHSGQYAQPVTPLPWLAGATVSVSTVARGDAQTIVVSAFSGISSPALVALEVHDPTFARVANWSWDRQSFVAGQTLTFITVYNVPLTATTGMYTVSVGLFAPGFSQKYLWNAAATKFTVT